MAWRGKRNGSELIRHGCGTALPATAAAQVVVVVKDRMKSSRFHSDAASSRECVDFDLNPLKADIMLHWCLC